MKLLPTPIKILLNILCYAIYGVLSLLLVSFIAPMLGVNIRIGSSQAEVIGRMIMIAVLIITVLFRKFFYIELKNK